MRHARVELKSHDEPLALLADAVVLLSSPDAPKQPAPALEQLHNELNGCVALAGFICVENDND